MGALIFLPAAVGASTAGDLIVNPQPTYAIPYGTEKILVLDLSLPVPPDGETYKVQSINLHNAGTADHTVISKLEIWEDGNSPGWDNDETEAAIILQYPFFDTAISGNFATYAKNDPARRIFVTVSLQSGFISETTFKLQLLQNAVILTNSAATGPTDDTITGLERTVRHDAAIPTTPVSPLAGTPQALATSAIRWYFTDLSNNEFGFKILDDEGGVVARKEEANLSYLDETGLQPDTEYAGRRVVAFNDRGESLSSALTVFPATRTLAEQKTTPIEEVVAAPTSSEPVVIQEIKKEPTLFETIQTKIADFQRQINELLQKLNELIQQQAATIWQALAGFLQAFLGR